MANVATNPDPRWARLDAPAKLALRWAAALADARGAAELDSCDVFAGLILADPVGSPARELLDYFDIPLGAVLRHYDRDPPDEDALLEAIRGQSAGPLDIASTPLIDKLINVPPTEPDDLKSVRDLFGRLLAMPGTTAMVALGGQLAPRGTSLDEVAKAYLDYLTGRRSFRAALAMRFPRRPPTISVPSYLPDQPPGTAGRADVADLVGIGADIDAFAYLIASNRLVPPLAIGLFGAWGAGKSYFLRAMRQRIDAVALAAASAPRSSFHANIVQIEFNAWQYVGGNLWASLLEHLFRNLRRSGDDSDALLAKRQRYWMTKVQEATEGQRQAEQKRGGLQHKRDEAASQVDLRRQEREQALAELERRQRAHPFSGWRPSREVRKKIKEAAGLDDVDREVDALVTELDNARQALRGFGAVLAPLRTGGWRYAVAVLVLLLIPPGIAFLLEGLHSAPLAAVMSTVAASAATVVGYLKMASRFVTKVTKQLAAAQADLAAEKKQQREVLDAELAQATRRLDSAQNELDAAVAEQQELTDKVDTLTAELAATTPRRMLSEFVTDRMRSEDYRSQLGVPALARRDLERLSQLVAAHRDNPADDRVPAEYAIDRIVLYIDDLDRCPTELVVQVLEAVHLLLAFPLFVVVVAVDSRWLTSSLREHYAQLDGDGAAPEDYLEKIFQIPFWVRPAGTEVRRQMLRRLLSPNLVRTDAGAERERDTVTDMAPDDLAEFRRVVRSFAIMDEDSSPVLTARTLTVGEDELQAVEDVADLIGPTPRATKRYVNLYLLAKSMGVGRGRQLPSDGQLAVLLAVVAGLPELAKHMLPIIADHIGAALPLSDLIPTDAKDDVAKDADTFSGWLAANPKRGLMDMSDAGNWISVISRFRFTTP